MNITQASAKSRKMKERALKMRADLWPGLTDAELWTATKGFAQVPRTLVYIINIIDLLTKNQPSGMTYLTLWCRLWEVGIVELASEKTMAFESGFTGERAVDTWRRRMRHLKKLGFIDYRPGKDHEFQWVLLLNPHRVIQQLGTEVQQRHWTGLLDRANEVGATDFDPPPAPIAPTTIADPFAQQPEGGQS